MALLCAPGTMLSCEFLAMHIANAAVKTLGVACRESKQPLLSVEGTLGPARLWLTSSLGILQTVMDYMSEVNFCLW